MKKKKLTSLDILDGTVGSSAALSRSEMKNIMAGSSTNCVICPPPLEPYYCQEPTGPPAPGCSWGTCPQC